MSLPVGDTITVWTFALAAGAEAVSEAFATLDAAERHRADRFATSELRTAFVLRRAARRRVLGRLTGCEPARLRFVEDGCGRPALDLTGAPAFSASDSRQLGILATAAPGAMLGADVECLRPGSHRRLAARALSPAERLLTEGLDDGARDAAFLRAWTAKEAFLKAVGTGLVLADLPRISLPEGAPPGPVERWTPLSLAGHLTRHGAWLVRHMPIGDAIACIAAQVPGPVELRRHSHR